MWGFRAGLDSLTMRSSRRLRGHGVSGDMGVSEARGCEAARLSFDCRRRGVTVRSRPMQAG
jgi:hypothetical protein